MSPWEWWAGGVGESCYEIAGGEPTREAVILAAMRELEPGDQFQIIEARSSSSVKYEGADFVPFVRTRNHEILTVGPRS